MEIVENLKRMRINNSLLLQEATGYGHVEKGITTSFLIEIKPGSRAYRYNVDIALITCGEDGVYEKNLAKGSDE